MKFVGAFLRENKEAVLAELLLKDEVYAIVGAAMEVHRSLGCGFLEAVYQEALGFEFRLRELPFVAQHELTLRYKDLLLNKTYQVDFLVFERIIVEIKALDALTGREESQLINYLKAANLEVGVLINFGAPSLQWKRKILSPIREIRGIRG